MAPTEDELMEMIDVGYERSAISKEGAYVLLHLVRALCRDNEDLAGDSDHVMLDLYTTHYGWERVIEREANDAISRMENDGSIIKPRVKDASQAMACAS